MASGISLANKSQLLFGFAVFLLLTVALSVPWFRTKTLVREMQHEIARQLAEQIRGQGTVRSSPRPAATPPPSPGCSRPRGSRRS